MGLSTLKLRSCPLYVQVATHVVGDALQDSKKWQFTQLLMPVIPPKQASLTVVLSIPYCRGRHQNDP